MLTLGVTGTDTGVGKTAVSCALVVALRRCGIDTAAMKPIETGVVRGAPGSDAVALWRAAGERDPLDDVSPVTFYEPVAPLIAAERSGTVIQLPMLDAAYERLKTSRAAIVVEGAGGLLVPIAHDLTFANLFVRWSLDMILVAANRLGALNHVLLTLEVARSRGLRVRAVVFNSADAVAPSLSQATNAQTLRELILDIPVLAFPRISRVASADELAIAAEASGLVDVIVSPPVAPAPSP